MVGALGDTGDLEGGGGGIGRPEMKVWRCELVYTGDIRMGTW